jgi:hypothetical protein
MYTACYSKVGKRVVYVYLCDISLRVFSHTCRFICVFGSFQAVLVTSACVQHRCVCFHPGTASEQVFLVAQDTYIIILNFLYVSCVCCAASIWKPYTYLKFKSNVGIFKFG